MLTMDPLAIIISGIFLVGGVITILQFIGDRPKREEVQQTIDRSVKPIAENVQYIRDRIDEKL
jgi:hypothetical protein